MAQYQIPDWLQPFKNEWMSAGAMARVMRLEGSRLALPGWIREIRGRLRSVQCEARNGKPTMKYLVKQVYACAKAHGLTVVPAEEAVPAEERIRQLEDMVARLTAQLHRVPHAGVAPVRTPPEWSASTLLQLGVRLTEVRPLAGVYFLLADDESIAYVGQSQNVLARMSGHTDKSFQSVRMIHVPDRGERLRLEAQLIGTLRPRYNLQARGESRQ